MDGERVSAPIIAEALAQAIDRARTRALPPAVREGYVGAALAGWEGEGATTVIGHARTLDSAGAAFVNGTAAHGEDFDDTFEGGPVHAGVVIVPALLAAAERHRIAGPDLLLGIAVGTEVMCRGSLVAPKRIHKAGFHPTAVLGAMGAAAGVAAALRLDAAPFASAQGLAGSMASGLIEYLSEGTWTKRMHPGWAAQAGYRAVALAKEGFAGPRTVWEGPHGFLHGFANTLEGAWEKLIGGFGERWVMETLAFKPYPCGTMIHPYIDCARRLWGVDPASIRSITCETAEGIVHRLWEPLADKQRPPNAYAAKFSVPYCVAYAILHGNVGLEAFTEENARDPAIAALAAKVRYEIDPGNPYPDNYTGHLRVATVQGESRELRQPHLRGGHHEPLTREDIEDKFHGNCRHGGWDDRLANRWLAMARGAFDAKSIDLKEFRA